MGRGLVPTPDNFGTTGDRPTHPALLDHLATSFVRDGWSTKRLIRSIMLSRTYGLSSHGDTALDPENRWYSRANRKRQDAENIRDTILLLSGQLDRTRGGMTIRNPGKYDLNYTFKTNRRSVYVPWFRNSVMDLFEVFDAANPNLVVGKRTTTTLPTQALFLMNSRFVREQAHHTAKRIIDEGASLPYASELILGRPPTPEEHRTLSAFLNRFPEDEQEEAWTQVCQSLFACIDFRYLD